MKFYAISLVSWPDLPDDYTGSAFVTLPNSLFKAERCREIYNNQLTQYELAEELGFDGVFIPEHHNSAYGMTPSPNLFAAMLARRTERMQIGVLGNALPLYGNPVRLAEEHAILDVVTGGRLISGFVVGAQPEYFGTGLNPAEARGRFREGLDLILRAWTEDGPFEHIGEYYKYRYVSPWPRPYQQPHPPVWIPGVGSVETIEFVAERGFTYCGVPFFAAEAVEQNYSLFRRHWVSRHGTPSPGNLSMLSPIYVSDTDAHAREEYETAVWYMARRLMTGQGLVAPGYMSVESTLRFMKIVGQDMLVTAQSWEELLEKHYVIAGSPATVANHLIQRIERLGAGNVVAFFNFGNLAPELVTQSMELFGKEVMPLVKERFPDGPVWAESDVPEALAVGG